MTQTRGPQLGEWPIEVWELIRHHGLVINVNECGSRVTCRPVPPTADHDFLVEITGHTGVVSDIVNYLSGQDFKWEGGEHYQQALAGDFMSFRRDELNLIVTANPLFAIRHRAATALCAQENLLDKTDRIKLFQAVLYGNMKWEPTDGHNGKDPRAGVPGGVDLSSSGRADPIGF